MWCLLNFYSTFTVGRARAFAYFHTYTRIDDLFINLITEYGSWLVSASALGRVYLSIMCAPSRSDTFVLFLSFIPPAATDTQKKQDSGGCRGIPTISARSLFGGESSSSRWTSSTASSGWQLCRQFSPPSSSCSCPASPCGNGPRTKSTESKFAI